MKKYPTYEEAKAKSEKERSPWNRFLNFLKGKKTPAIYCIIGTVER
jgi:hypothetical protein